MLVFDSAIGCGVHSTLPAGLGYATLELHVNFTSAATNASGILRAEGRVLHRGSRIATGEGRVPDAQGRLIAHATETHLLFTPSDAR